MRVVETGLAITQHIASQSADLPTRSNQHRMPRSDVPFHSAPQARIKVCLAGNVDSELAATYQFELNGMEEAIEFYRSHFTNRRFGMHNGHTPEVVVNGDQATSLWYLNDLFINLDEQTMLNGSALYEDHYIKLQGEWRIIKTGYKRLLEMIGPLDAQWKITSQPTN